MNKKKRLIVFMIALLIVPLFIPPQVHATNIWAIFNEANQAQNNGRYEEAIEKFEKVLPYFINNKDDINVALIYGKLGRCWAELSEFDKATQSWEKEAAMWGKLDKKQDQLIALRKASYTRSTVKLFTEICASSISNRHYNSVKYEPVLGAYIGAYAENDPAVHEGFGFGKFYMDNFPKLTGKKHAAYLLYQTYGLPFSHYGSHYERAKEANVAIQLALQPVNGLDKVQDDAYLRQFARDAKESGIPIFLRFANEMNDSGAPWYGNPSKYIEKFRLVARVFHEEAPNVVMVWAPNDFPPNTIEDYYPGDEYVDWVGLSTYHIHTPELDPLQRGVVRENYVEKLENIHSLYGDRKPIYVSEGAVSYTHIHTGVNVTEWAAREIEHFFTYLPMLYPSVKAYFWFSTNDFRETPKITRSFTLSKNNQILSAYKKAIQNPYYLSNLGDIAPVFYSNVTEMGLAPRNQILHSYVKAAEPDIKEVVYKIGNEIIGIATSIPWTINYDFKKHAGKKLDITVEAYGQNNQLIVSKNISTNVGSANILLNNRFLDFDAQPIIQEGRTMVPIRQITEATNAVLRWNGEQQSFTISKDGTQLVLQIGSKKALKNGETLDLDVAPFISNNRSYLPLRFIAEEVLNLNTKWDQETLTVSFE